MTDSDVSKCNDIIDHVKFHAGNNKLRKVFGKHLELVLEALRVMARRDNGYASDNEEKEAIEKVLSPDSAQIEDAEKILASLYHAIEDAEKVIASIHKTIEEAKNK